MKRKIKNMLGVIMALTMAASATTSAIAEEKTDFTGTIDAAALKISVEVPTSGTMVIKPFGKTQIDTGVNYLTSGFQNKKADNATSYDVVVAGYTAVLNSTGEVLPTLSTTNTFTGTAKSVYMNIELGAAVISTDKITAEAAKDATERAKYDAYFTSAKQTVNVARASEEKYDPKNPDSVYTKAADSEIPTPKVVLAPGYAIPFRVSGKMNTDAKWEAGDSIAVTPVFKIVPNPTDDTGVAGS